MNETNPFRLDPPNGPEERLAKDLAYRYATGREDDQHLAHVREHLLTVTSAELQPVKGASGSTNREHERQGHRKANAIIRGVWLNRMSQVAAVVFITLLVGALLLVFSHHPHTTTGTATGGTLLAVRSFLMNDATTGWILTERTVLRTTDGGRNWKNVTPPRVQLSANSIAVFHNTTLAWIVVPQETKATIEVWRTNDGGATWQSSTLAASFPRAITVVDALHGWLLTSQSDQQDVPAEAVQLYRTSDGGKTWTELLTANALVASTDGPPAGHLPYGGQKSEMHFVNETTGWVTGTVIVNGLSWLYVTHDAGATWNQQHLPLAASTPSAQLVVSHPIFFTAHDGLLPVTFLSHGVCIYVTHDAGTTWQPTSLAPLVSATVAFADMQHGWMTNGSDLLVTTDGGHQWRKQATNSSFEHITTLVSTSPTVGWAVRTQAGASTILKTEDGGHTWIAL